MSKTISHQTVRLTRGRHTRPDAGVCVMELASMLAGEPFSDQPASVCPALGAILRPYNDSLDNVRRQDLYEYASRVVGTRGGRSLARRRANAAFEFFSAEGDGMPLGLRIARRIPGGRMTTLARACLHYARRIDDRSHAAALALVDRLIATGEEPAASLDGTAPGSRGAAPVSTA